ncbi:type VI secretion system baseplate subunit TssG [Nibrella viscosa]|uniref:Type VI secretion system baseplate subunit TssG n=1 Tax=Nibrella viscosa TaxID=1084524 RepID=A0ABP8JSE8_9BACT
METLDSYAKRLNRLPIDLRLEVVLADMLEDGVSLDDLIVNPLGSFNRPFGRDIADTEWVEAQHGHRRWLQINVNRNGIYDFLPEGVFHQPTSDDTLATQETILREIKIQREREEAARRFFLPLEQEFFRQRVRIEQEERTHLAQHDPFSLDDNLVAQFWELPDFLTTAQAKRLVYLLPVVYQFVGDLHRTALCFEQLLGERVSLQPELPGLVSLSADTPPLGQWQLGNDSLFGGYVREEGEVIRLRVHLSRADQVPDYLPGSNGRRVINLLQEYLLPMDTTLVVELDTSAFENAFILDDIPDSGLLDFTTCL